MNKNTVILSLIGQALISSTELAVNVMCLSARRTLRSLMKFAQDFFFRVYSLSQIGKYSSAGRICCDHVSPDDITNSNHAHSVTMVISFDMDVSRHV